MPILGILWAINGYLTIFGLVTESVGIIVEGFEPAVGQPIKETGAVITAAGATRKGVKKYQGKPVF